MKKYFVKSLIFFFSKRNRIKQEVCFWIITQPVKFLLPFFKTPVCIMSVFKKCMSSLPEVFYEKVFLAAESALNGLVSIWWVLRHERVNEPILWTNINPHLVPLVFTHLAHNRGIMHRDFPIKLLRLKKNYLNNDLRYCRKASLMKIALLPRYFWSNISMSKLFMATSEAYRTSRLEVFCKKGVLKNFANFTGKNLCQSLGLELCQG